MPILTLEEDASRVFPALVPGPVDQTVWSMALGITGLHVVLDLHDGDTRRRILKDELPGPDHTSEEWLQAAYANLHQATPADYLQPVLEGVELSAGTATDGYGAARALIVDRLVTDDEDCGYFVAVPGENGFGVMRVTQDHLGQVHHLKRFAMHNYNGHDAALSQEIFWVHHGAWHPYHVEIIGEMVKVTAPREFGHVVVKYASTPSDQDASESTPAPGMPKSGDTPE